ncbi:hypothetical protein Fcan01_24219 [Folsomia candida]|uniref:Uncharacterized protein n=1 Tax=Folsomia candida TaxID=158441 RepID=A0A226D776_FOLCA|nr:hypothetical protein Fcan01_24219 [Folsomia candida]
MERLGRIFSVLRRIAGINQEFRQIKWLCSYQNVPTDDEFLSINDMMNTFQNTNNIDELKERILEDPIGYAFFMDENRQDFITCMENCFRGNSFSPDKAKLSYSDKIDIISGHTGYDVAIEESLITLIEDKLVLKFSDLERQRLQKKRINDYYYRFDNCNTEQRSTLYSKVFRIWQ